MAKKSFSLIVCLLACTVFSIAQDMAAYKSIVRELSSEKYNGRGYAGKGVVKAANYIENKFKEAGADQVVLQPFTLDINTFPKAMEIWVDGHRLAAGSEFVLREYSPGVRGRFPLYYIDTLKYDAVRIFADLDKPEYKDAFVVCDFWFTYRHREDFKRLSGKDGSNNAGLIYTWETPLKFYKAYGEKVADKPTIWVSSSFPKDAKEVSMNIYNKFFKDYVTANVIAKIEGRRHDSCYVFTAHYDHLGNLGRKVFYPGANDNASGTAAIVTLAAYYAVNQPEFDVWCIAFSGEDANLRGSTYFVNNPLFPLKSIKYLFNLDMIGDNNPVQYCEVSDEGLRGFSKMERINAELQLFKALNRGKLAANSDHWSFAQQGVPCILFENENGDNFKYYHTPEDNWDNAVFDTYAPIFKLVTGAISEGI